jgi:hypothetical protein
MRQRGQELVLQLGRVLRHRPCPLGDQDLIAQLALADDSFADIFDDADRPNHLAIREQWHDAGGLRPFADARGRRRSEHGDQVLVETMGQYPNLAVERAEVVLFQTARLDRRAHLEERPADGVFGGHAGLRDQPRIPRANHQRRVSDDDAAIGEIFEPHPRGDFQQVACQRPNLFHRLFCSTFRLLE